MMERKRKLKRFEEPVLKIKIFMPKDILTSSAEEEMTEQPTEKPPVVPVTPPDNF